MISTSSIIVENAPPIGKITVLTESLYAGERIVLSALASTDADNSIVITNGLGKVVAHLDSKHRSSCLLVDHRCIAYCHR